MRILITGGAGYIGSACEEAGHEVVVLDDLSAGRREFVGDRTFYEGDIADQDLLDRVFSENQIDAVVHCAAKIIVPHQGRDAGAHADDRRCRQAELFGGLADEREFILGSRGVP